ncbi:MAG: hypothetical protein WD512_15395 [Candidatus Paceibacterota bacterium]
MKKLLKKWGGGLAVYFNKEDIKINNFSEGQILDIHIQKLGLKGGSNNVRKKTEN